MSDEWIKFDEREPTDGQLIWLGNYYRVASPPERYRPGPGRPFHTYWMPCVTPDPPKRPLPELPDGFVFACVGQKLEIRTVGKYQSRVVFYDQNGVLCVTLIAERRHLAAQLIAAFDEAEKYQ